MTKGEQNLRAVAFTFALEQGLELETRWTTTGLEIEFVERKAKDKMRRFMRCTISTLQVPLIGRADMDLLKVQWRHGWTNKTNA